MNNIGNSLPIFYKYRDLMYNNYAKLNDQDSRYFNFTKKKIKNSEKQPEKGFFKKLTGGKD
jgi:hypothetical protein